MNTENNKIIAEFMGWKIQKDPTERFFGRYRNPIGTWYKEIDLAFHHDWNWLMEVVKKIRSIDSTAKEEFRTNLLHYQRNNRTIFDLSILEGKEYVYKYCVEFIKWYNNQNSANKTEKN